MIEGSVSSFLQMAHDSVHTDHAHVPTAFQRTISKGGFVVTTSSVVTTSMASSFCCC